MPVIRSSRWRVESELTDGNDALGTTKDEVKGRGREVQ